MSFSKKALLGAVAVSASLSLALTACGGGSNSSNGAGGSSAGASTVTVFTGQVGNYTANFDPFNPTGSYLQPTNGVIYEALFYYNKAAAGAPVPLLGQSFSWNKEGTELTVKLRAGTKWSDGTDLTSEDVAFSLNLVSKTPALNTSGMQWTAAATDATTVTVTFPKTAFTLEAQLLGNEPIVPESIWKSISDPTTTTNDKPVGSGPYMLKTFTPQSFTLVKNPHYWGTGADAPGVDQVRYVSLANADAATTALESGQVDLMGSFLPTLKNIEAQNKNVTDSNTPQATAALFTCANADMGCTGPQTDPAVRQAIYYAMDRTQLNTQALGGYGKPASSSLLLNFVNQDQITDPSYMEVPQTADVAKATGILEAAGYTKGGDGYYAKDGKPIELTVNVVSGWTDYDTVCTLLQGQLKAAGIKLNVNQVAQNAWTQAEVSGKYELSLNSLNMGASSNPYYTYNNYLNSKATAKVGDSAATNVTRYSNSDVDAAITSLASTNDPATQKQDYATIQKQVVKDMPYIPIYVNQALTEYNTTHATGWPSANDLYAFPLPWGGNWGMGLVLKRIRPVS